MMEAPYTKSLFVATLAVDIKFIYGGCSKFNTLKPNFKSIFPNIPAELLGRLDRLEPDRFKEPKPVLKPNPSFSPLTNNKSKSSKPYPLVRFPSLVLSPPKSL